MASADITIRGGTGLQPACGGDRILTEIVEDGEMKTHISSGCWKCEVYTLADMTLPDGMTLRPEACEGGAWGKATQHDWTGLIRKLVCKHGGRVLHEDYRLTNEIRHGHTWHRRGRVVMWEQHGVVQVGRVLAQLQDRWLAVQQWWRHTEVTTTRRSKRARVGLGNVGGAELWGECNANRSMRVLVHTCKACPVDAELETTEGEAMVWKIVDSGVWIEK